MDIATFSEKEHIRPKILLVDDLQANLTTLQFILAELPVEIECKTSALQTMATLSKCTTEEYALFIFDVQMPEMNGFDLANAVREIPMFQHTPIIFVTAVYTDHIFKVRGFQSGAVDYLEKPFLKEALLGKVSYYTKNFIYQQQLKQEIAERQKAEYKATEAIQEMQRIRDRYASVLEQQNGFTFSCYKEQNTYRYTLCRGKLMDKLGILPSAIEGKTLDETVRADDVERRRGYYNMAWSGREVSFIATSPHDEFHYIISLTPITENGRVVELLGTSVDITEIKNLEKKLALANAKLEKRIETSQVQLEVEVIRNKQSELLLQDSNRRWRELIEVNKNFFVCFDEKENITYTNEAFNNFLQSSALHPTHIFEKFTDCLSSVGVADFRLAFSSLLQGAHTSTFESEFIRDGIYYTYQWVISPLQTSLSMPDQEYQAVGVDISDIRRTAQHTQQLLAKEQELHNLKNYIITTLSHQFRTPLAVIANSAHMLERYLMKMSEEQRVRSLKNISSSVHLVVTMLEDIIFYGKLRAGEIEKHLQTIHIQPAIELAVIQVQYKYPSCSIDMDTNIPAVKVLADERHLNIILKNILDNACKFSHSGGKVWIRTEQQEEHTITIIIEDEGIGIPQHEQQDIFTPLHRGTNAETIQGTGFGLSIVQALLHSYAGSIDFTSVEGKGSTFRLTLITSGRKEEE